MAASLTRTATMQMHKSSLLTAASCEHASQRCQIFVSFRARSSTPTISRLTTHRRLAQVRPTMNLSLLTHSCPQHNTFQPCIIDRPPHLLMSCCIETHDHYISPQRWSKPQHVMPAKTLHDCTTARNFVRAGISMPDP